MSENDIPPSDLPVEDRPADAPVEMPLPRLPRPPFWMVAILLVAVTISWFPLVLAAVARTSKRADPRIALMQDMGVQPKYREQQTSPIFADGRAMRPAIPGTVAWSDMDADHPDDHYYHGFTREAGKVKFFTGFPKAVKVDMALLERGQERFNIYCSACHGLDGSGHGPVNERALQLMDIGANGTSWTQAANLHDKAIMGREEGNLFNTITNGVRNMPGYGTQVAVADRWAIVAYVRALELSQDAPKSVLSSEQLSELSVEHPATTTAPATEPSDQDEPDVDANPGMPGGK